MKTQESFMLGIAASILVICFLMTFGFMSIQIDTEPINPHIEAQNISDIDVLNLTAEEKTFKFVEFPQDRINISDIYIENSNFCVENIDYIISDMIYYAKGSGSMYPLLYKGAETILIKPPESEIKLGDIINFRVKDVGLIVHRIVKIGTDDTGKYFVTRGDNNPVIDEYKIRYKNIEGVVIAILY